MMPALPLPLVPALALPATSNWHAGRHCSCRAARTPGHGATTEDFRVLSLSDCVRSWGSQRHESHAPPLKSAAHAGMGGECPAARAGMGGTQGLAWAIL